MYACVLGLYRRVWRAGLALLVAAVATVPGIGSSGGTYAAAQGQGQSRLLGPGGIAVAGRFLDVWNAQGSEQNSVYVNGYPITPRRPEISVEDGRLYDTQWFERARYELHPANKAPNDVLLGRLGADMVQGRGGLNPATGKVRYPTDAAFVGIDTPPDADGKGKAWFNETRHSVGGKFLEYWRKYGGLAQFGYPLSEPLREVSPTDGKLYDVQYFERNRFELHPDKPAPYEVELGLLGVQQYRATPVPADQLPIAPPPNVTSSKDTLVQGSQQEPTDLVGFETDTTVAHRILDAVTFNSALVHGDERENYFPLAAWYVPTLESGGSYYIGTGEDRHLVTRYKLRPGIKWADGTEVTSADAVFANQFLLNDPNVSGDSARLLNKLSSVDNPDKYTVMYHWLSLREAKARSNDPKADKNGVAPLKTYIDAGVPVTDKVYFLVGMVLPRWQLSKIAPNKVTESDYARNPMGYGPYRVQEWKQGEQMTLVVNENYNLTAPPLIKTVVQKFITDINQNVAGFVAGKLDAIAGDGTVVPPEQSPQLVQANGIIKAVPASSWEHLEFSFKYAPFGDKRVRQAIIQAINRQHINDVVFKGAGTVPNGPTPASVYFSLENPDFAKEFPDLAQKYKLPVYPYDPAAANRLLDESGWVRGADGIRVKDGQKLSFEYGTYRNAPKQAIQALVALDLKTVGIDAIVVNYPLGIGFCWSDCVRQLFGSGKSKLNEFSFTQTSLTGYNPFSIDELWDVEHQDRQNLQQYRSEKVTQANRTFNLSVDRRETAEAAAQAQVEIMNDIAVVPLVQRPNIEIYKSNLQNRKVTNSPVSQWWNITQWYFK